MMRRAMILGTLMIAFLGVTLLSAHDEFRVIGTITKLQDSKLEVKTKEGKTISIAMKKDTLVYRDKQKVAATELKVGRTVVVDALGDSIDELLALEVNIVPAIVPSPVK